MFLQTRGCQAVKFHFLSMEAATKTPASLSLPWKTRILLWVLSAVTEAARRKDGTVNRRLIKFFDYRSPPTSKPRNGVKTYDVVVDPARKLWFRVFLPIQHAVEDLPVIVFFHGGGFVFLSPDMKFYDDVCRRFARKLPAIIVSVDYRLAPEHPYPAQHDDCFDVLKFLDDDQENGSKSLPENVNISRCFLVGDSAGGNLAHHVAQRACEFNFHRLKVIGVVAIQPFFGGMERTDSEIELEGTPLVSLKRTDWYWKSFMPAGEGYDRGHPIINVSGPKAVDISNMDIPATMVVVGGFDALKDWQRRYYEWVKNSGKEIASAFGSSKMMRHPTP
ncbi:Alpha/beta hydrolase fold-3 [Cynara cardunculus var. scolymus]|uniref:Alpha/beta hydrolase fold-3 n=1 Tax=Cynara cardunculus var. scolymus TaxID=59895 RepID=A0A103YMH4_CYNCS|nr:Alpha/beta hydrolase fold-3 [Cynara cardunculus var. scolymus]